MMDVTKRNHPILVLVRGLPGSGKSYLAEALQKALGASEVVVLDPDATDYDSQKYLDFSKNLTAEGVEEKFHPYRFLRAQAHQAVVDHKIIIWTQAFTNLDGFQKTVVNLQNHATEHDTQLPLLVVEVEANHDVVKARAAEREQATGRGVSEEAWERFINDYRSFASEGYNTVTINGEDDVNTSVTAVRQALEKL